MRKHGIRTCLPIFASLLILCIADLSPAADSANVYRSFGPIDIMGDDSSYFQAGAGSFNIKWTGVDTAGVAGVQARLGKKYKFVGPVAGIIANTDGGYYGYGGIYSDFSFGNFISTLVLAAGGYERGGGKDLGGVFQFREELSLSYRFVNRYRVGVMFSHISNAKLHDRNPGENDLMLICSVPF
jgi:hypothetical protein